MLSTATHIIVALSTAMSLLASEPFTVSLDYSPAADLSEHYRALIHSATQRYRGDGDFVVGHVYSRGSFGRPGTFETEEFTGDALADHIYLYCISSSGTRELISEAHFLLDPFPPKRFTLRSSP